MYVKIVSLIRVYNTFLKNTMYTLNCKGRLLVIENPVVMGILNITPDSFYSGSRVPKKDEMLQKAGQMLKEEAVILDIGGQSTRPGSKRLTAEEEMDRVLPAVEVLKATYPDCFISVDTFYSAVAKASVNAGADIINDISAGELDDEMIPTVAALNVPYIAMHMKGTPDIMQSNPAYENVTREVVDYFITKVEQCKTAGIKDVVIDPGFGFGKTIQHNLQLLKNMEVFQMFHIPVLAGLSRKSTIWKTLGITSEEALNGTTVLNTIALQKGATILRVHDVKEAVEATKLFSAYTNA